MRGLQSVIAFENFGGCQHQARVRVIGPVRVSGQDMLEALLKGSPSPEQVAQFARWDIEAKDSRHYRRFAGSSVQRPSPLSDTSESPTWISWNRRYVISYHRQFELLQTIPGI
jgi:hypothetical protein